MSIICGIYKITNPKGLVYIGQSYNVYSRFTRYKKLSCKSQCRIYNSLVKYGPENHTFELLEQAPKEQLNQLEINYIWRYDSTNREKGLNLNSGGFNGNHSKETKDKIRQKALGRKASASTKKKMSDKRLGIKKSEEWKHNMSKSSAWAKKIYTVINGKDVIFSSITEASKFMKIRRTSIQSCLKGKTKTSGKHIWKFV